MTNEQEFPYPSITTRGGRLLALPQLSILLSNENREVRASALLDTGAAVSVLPYGLGVALGLRWEEQRISAPLTGNLSASDSRAVLIVGQIGFFEPVRLAFAWTAAEDVPLILGQTNFFDHFDVCFFRSRGTFTLSRA